MKSEWRSGEAARRALHAYHRFIDRFRFKWRSALPERRVKIDENTRGKLKGRVGNELEKVVRNSPHSANPSVARIFFSPRHIWKEGKWVTRLNGSQDIVPSIIQYGLGASWPRRHTSFSSSGDIVRERRCL